MTIIESLNSFITKRKAFQEELKAAALKTIGGGLQEFMQLHPEIDQLRWAQYTPYFNDGDTCEFSVHDIYVHVTSESADSDSDNEIPDCEYGDGEGWTYAYKRSMLAAGLSELTATALEQLQSALSSAKEELKYAFGDHVEVVVTKDGIDVEEYEHD